MVGLTKARRLIIIPTTCGTGSEVTNISILNRTRLGTKQGLVSPAMFADHAVLIPEFLQSLPYSVFATSSIDALIHAVESYLSPSATPYTEMYSLQAMQDILRGYCQIAERGQHARFQSSAEYLRASNYAGIAFSNSGCAAVHAMSYALGGKYHVAHGESNYQFFTDVLRKYQEKKPDGKSARWTISCRIRLPRPAAARSLRETLASTCWNACCPGCWNGSAWRITASPGRTSLSLAKAPSTISSGC